MNLMECPVCSSGDLSKVLDSVDQLVSRETFEISECNNCTLRFTNPRPDSSDLSKYYQSEDYISHTNEGTSLINKIYKVARFFTLRSKRKLIEQQSSGRKLLDVGCGTGHFISHCSENNWTTYGVEPDDDAREIALASSNSQVLPELNKVQETGFDRITLWHVLEHLPNLKDNLRTISNLLSEDGKLFIAVPNYLAYEEEIFKGSWAAYDVPRHLYHFTPKSIEILLKENGLILEKAYPMWLDSFYISLLSNKHKYGDNKYLKSFITGLLSNVYAIKSRNFSSLIYKFKKLK